MMESKAEKYGGDQEIEQSQTTKQLSIPESQPTQLNDELSDLRTRLASYETRLRQLAELLSEAHAQVSNKREILHWIVNSRSWKITFWLRLLNFSVPKFHLRARRSGRDCFSGMLERPANGSKSSGYLEVAGWVHSSAAPITRVEAFLDCIPLGLLQYGQARPDIAAYPSQSPINCGYRGDLLIDESFAGRRTLTVRVTDKRGHIKDYTRTVLIEDSAEQMAFSGLKLIHALHRTADGALNPFLRDDLSTAKRLLAQTSKIALESFLVSKSILEFPEHENPQLSMILVLYNRAELTLQCLYSILKNNLQSYEVIIIDNASTDQTGQLLQQIKGAQIIKNQTNVHYLLACNQASRRARGSYILLLNNDAQVQGDSISSALKTLDSSADIGAVGGKIILPDGTLQEAGSIIWQDGSCLGYGRGDSPFAPAYMFKRDVDYCSAAFLLTRRDLFSAGGGFDEAYAPAYYEETDYCVRLWKQGQRVVYDPDVTVIHYEFASSDSKQSATRLQAEHQRIFVTRHQDWLQSQLTSSPENILNARIHARRGAKRILLIDDRVPHITSGSGFPRSNRIIRELVGMGHLLTCYPLDRPQEDWPSVYQDVPREVEVILDYGLPRLEKFLTERLGYYDRIFVSRPQNMSTLKSLLRKKPQLRSGTKIIYDAEALFSLREIEKLRLNGKRLSPQKRQRMIDEEMKLAEDCDLIITVSEMERREFVRYGFEHVYILGHAVAPSPTPNNFAARSNILFVGALHTLNSPNADSVLWFSRKVFPKIRKQLGDAVNLIIAGPIHPDLEERMAEKSVQVRGELKDLTAVYNDARIFIAPTRYSAGIPHKVHEAAAHGLPVVATSLTGHQLGWDHEEDLLLADDQESFAAACIRLYQDRELWTHLRQNALNRVARECSPEIFSERLKDLIE